MAFIKHEFPKFLNPAPTLSIDLFHSINVGMADSSNNWIDATLKSLLCLPIDGGVDEYESVDDAVFGEYE